MNESTPIADLRQQELCKVVQEGKQRANDINFLRKAWQMSLSSRDPSTKCGAIITIENELVTGGFNHFPNGIPEAEEKMKNGKLKYEIVIHAEVSAILRAKMPLEGTTMYVWPMPPCSRCTSIIIEVGIKRVVSCLDNIPERWKENVYLAGAMLDEAGVIADILSVKF